MAVELVMPRLSDSMEEATILKWLKGPGDAAARGDALAEIETDKATMTYEAEDAGVLLEILAAEGETVALGAPIAWFGQAGETVPASDGGPADPAPAAAPPAAVDPQAIAAAAPAPTGAGTTGSAPAAAPTAPGERAKATPVARRIALDGGIDLAAVAGTGPGGRITKADVQAALRRQADAVPAAPAAPAAAADAPVVAPAPDAVPAVASAASAKGETRLQELTRLQQTVARRMSESKATVPEFVLFADVDMTACVELRATLKQIADPAPSYNDMIVKAAALALREFPRANGSYRDGGFELHERVNVGIAVAADDALVVPTVFDADRRALGEIARETRELARAVREGDVTSAQLAGGTFTISNLGMFGVGAFAAIVNPPQAAILSVGAMTRRPVVDEHDAIVARDVLTLGLICDHRILYGADAARFLGRIRELLERPLSMAL